MLKRLAIGLASGALLAAMLPGVAQAVPDWDKKGPIFEVIISCEREVGGPLTFSTVAAAGYAQSSLRWVFNNDPDAADCIPNTKRTTITKL